MSSNMFIRHITLWSLILLFHLSLTAQSEKFKSVALDLKWEDPAQRIEKPSGSIHYLRFDGAAYDEQQMLPVWTHKFRLPYYSTISVSIENPQYEAIDSKEDWGQDKVSENLAITSASSYFRGSPMGTIQMVPIRKNPQTGQYERLIKATVQISYRRDKQHEQLRQSLSLKSNNNSSVLASGSIFKIGLKETGIYKLDYKFLKDSLGIDVDNIDPRNIQLFGNGGSMLPETVGDPTYIDDLAEAAIFISGESDGQFDSEDYILFYARGSSYWTYNSSSEMFVNSTNHYTDQAIYFLKIGTNNGKRISNRASLSSSNYSTSSYDSYAHYEENSIHLMETNFALPPSGRLWVGDPFQVTRNQSFGLSFENRIETAPVKMRMRYLSRFFSGSGNFEVNVNGNNVLTENLYAVSSYVYDPFAYLTLPEFDFLTSGNSMNINIQFNQGSSGAEAWLDFITMNARCNLIFNYGQLAFRDAAAVGNNNASYQISSSNSNLNIWDVTDLHNVVSQEYSGSNTLEFTAPADTLREFIAYDGSSFLRASALGPVNNQNLHGITAAPDLVIVYHPDFEAAASRLAAHRRSYSGLSVVTTDINEIYNEFASGQPDICAVRNYARMLYDRSSGTDSLRYLLLLGAGTYDYKGINNQPGTTNPNFIPIFQTNQSIEPLNTYMTDDFYAMLDIGEGNVNSAQDLDIAVGRIPVKTVTEAEAVVDKIIRYDYSASTLGDWRNILTFIADDEDGNLHIRDADNIALNVAANNPNYNVDKIYADAYEQISTSGGSRYPNVVEAIKNRIFKGSLVVNYLGHGGGDGWAQERIFTNTEIRTLANENKLPLFITATCSFAPIDDPSYQSAGELLLLNPSGGAIALMTTVRVVFANANEELTSNTFDKLFEANNGVMPTIGEVLQNAKNSSGTAGFSNSRKFVLLGDPSMKLAYPKYKVATTNINGQAISGNDTIQALQQVTISGEIQDDAGNLLSNYNGVIYPTVFDKTDTLQTRANDAGSQVRSFLLQKKVIFRGPATVSNGKFSFSFIVPVDINYQYGFGKISYYADDRVLEDAHGNYSGLIIGGTYANASEDEEGPIVQVYMNNEDFASGGITDNKPMLLAKLQDDSGINTVGNGIGHDLTGVLSYLIEEEDGTSYNLNDYYETNIDDFTSGKINYPLSNLKDGRYRLQVKAWDVYNNMGEGETEFVVASSSDIALDHVLNYPNPFVNNTEFMFEHNLPGQELDVLIQIYTVSGKLVKSINRSISAVENDGYRIRGIQWDGLDDYGSKIGNGVYVYKINVRASAVDANDETTIQQSSEYQKLVILR